MARAQPPPKMRKASPAGTPSRNTKLLQSRSAPNDASRSSDLLEAAEWINFRLIPISRYDDPRGRTAPAVIAASITKTLRGHARNEKRCPKAHEIAGAMRDMAAAGGDRLAFVLANVDGEDIALDDVDGAQHVVDQVAPVAVGSEV